jgi:hypothetical protein
MADRKFIRPVRIGRPGGRKVRTDPVLAHWLSRAAPPSQPLAPSLMSSEVQRTLSMVAQQLKLIHAVAVTVEHALRNQNCEQNVEFANCLRVGVSIPVSSQATLIEHVFPPRKPR